VKMHLKLLSPEALSDPKCTKCCLTLWREDRSRSPVGPLNNKNLRCRWETRATQRLSAC